MGNGGGNSSFKGPEEDKLGVCEELGKEHLAEAWWARGQCYR